MAEHPEAATFVHAIDRRRWCNYKALLDPDFTGKLYGKTGSVMVEGEMSRFIKVGVRHSLPAKAVSNYINFYADLICTQRKKVEDPTLLVVPHLSLKCRNAVFAAAEYMSTPVSYKRYNVARIGQTDKWRSCIYAPQAQEMWCSCEVPRLEGVVCPHLCCIYLTATLGLGYGSSHFLHTFSCVLPKNAWKEEYAKGYAMGCGRPVMTCVVNDDTLAPPQVVQPRGTKRQKRWMSISERGFRKQRPVSDLAQTQKNKSNSLDNALLAEHEKPARALRQVRSNGYGYGGEKEEEEEGMSMLGSVADLIGSALICTGNAFRARR
jgi:hypothetical protein